MPGNARGIGLSNYNIIYTNGILTVSIAMPTMGLASARNPVNFGDGTFFAATLAAGLTDGAVQFLTNGVLFDTQPVANGLAASRQVFDLPVGTNTITVVFSGALNFWNGLLLRSLGR